ncbi:Detected protein of unknown function [Hibiscus syriacus]|uniref:Serine-rich protein-related n=1 Tax=Hibiscus syriacus TaxID=106335 RepID=A0A6A3B2J2_HIBSY|nr:Detected protein of unknown function [Hibiscus syriacus]
MATNSLPTHCSKRVCLCSPTNHPGSFRCSLHRSLGKVSSKSVASASHVNRLKDDQSKAAMMLMMSTVSSSSSKSSLIKAFLMQIIRPSSHGLRRRRNFHPKPSRFSSLQGSANGVAVS